MLILFYLDNPTSPVCDIELENVEYSFHNIVLYIALFVWLPQVSALAVAAAAATASMRTVVVRFADADDAVDAAAYYIATADFIGVSRRTRHSDAASDAASCVNETNKS
ncbi:unnamed protein product [Brassica napus]|uniref:(rape) hypothetical protein n=1 Tax=Brassica napus TaxID=3708 RepID=A0A816W5C7_BRANA|nr:unnamed protein product [Brassica napus]